MKYKKLERYGNECIIGITLILDDDVLIKIERISGWNGEIVDVSSYTENAEQIFNELLGDKE